MKIAFINQPWNYCPPVRGGSIAIGTYEVARRLARSCDVIVYARSGLQKKVEWEEAVHYRRFPIGIDNLILGRLKQFAKFYNFKRPLFTYSGYYLGYILQVANDLRRQQCDIVHLHNLSHFVPVIRAFNPNIKIVLHMHCEWLTQLDRTMIERRLCKTNLVIGCSEYITEKIRRCFPQFASRCQTVYNGVDISRFISKSDGIATKSNDARRLLFVGRVSPEKGLHVLVDAFQKVVLHYPQAQLEIVGKGAPAPIEFIVALSGDPKVTDLAVFYSKSYLSHLRNELSPGVASQVHFTGAVPHLQVIKHYQNADVFILPSVWDEPFGMPLIEAMACQVPVVATRSGGMPEIVQEGKTGLLVERGNATALAEAILCLLADKDLRKSMGQAGRQRVLQTFSWEWIAENVLYLHKSML